LREQLLAGKSYIDLKKRGGEKGEGGKGETAHTKGAAEAAIAR
jgi:hypothetical protein